MSVHSIAAIEVSPATNAGKHCLICDTDQSTLVCIWDQRRIEKCLGCGVLFTLPRPSEEELVCLYDNGSIQGVFEDGAALEPLACPDWKFREHSRILDRLTRLTSPSGKLLDVGCLWGFFLAHARQKGFDVAGVEPCSKAVRYVRDVLGLAAYQGSLQSAAFASASFDAVSILDVIEHLPDPVAELREAYRILKPAGLLVIVTPDSNGLLPRLIGMKRKTLRQPWCPIDNVPWHLWGFTPATIALCVEKAGFNVEAIESLEPSVLTTNRTAGSTLGKKLALWTLAGLSQALGRSDRSILFARKGVFPAA